MQKIVCFFSSGLMVGQSCNSAEMFGVKSCLEKQNFQAVYLGDNLEILRFQFVKRLRLLVFLNPAGSIVHCQINYFGFYTFDKYDQPKVILSLPYLLY